MNKEELLKAIGEEILAQNEGAGKYGLLLMQASAENVVLLTELSERVREIGVPTRWKPFSPAAEEKYQSTTVGEILAKIESGKDRKVGILQLADMHEQGELS